MDADDILLIERTGESEPELRHLYLQHQRLGARLAELDTLRNPTAAEHREISDLKFKKLHGKNRIQQILTGLRAADIGRGG